MSTYLPQSQLLNESNQLIAHRVSPDINSELVERCLELMIELFPHESSVEESMRTAYRSLMSGDGRFEDCQLLEYFVYTAFSGGQQVVIGMAGIYRHDERSPSTDALLAAIANNPPPGFSPCVGKRYEIGQCLWGGRLGIRHTFSSSPQITPFIIQHILLRALGIIQSESLLPLFLAFTQKSHNDQVQGFYRHMGFRATGTTLEFAGEAQDVIALHLAPDAQVMKLLDTYTRRARRNRNRS